MKKIFPIVISLLTVLLSMGCGASNNRSPDAELTPSSQEPSVVTEPSPSIAPSADLTKEPTPTMNPDYLTETDWAQEQSLMFAVEVNSINGDIFASGTYRFYESLISGGTVPVIWDVYISANEYSSLADLKESEFAGSVGGVEKAEITAELQPGRYVYVVYNDVLGEMGSIISIVKVDNANLDSGGAG
jgi:hypothetical protein